MSLTIEAKEALDRLVAKEPPSGPDISRALDAVRADISQPPDWKGYPTGPHRFLGLPGIRIGGITSGVLK